MKKSRLFLLLCTVLVLFSCGDSIDKYKVKTDAYVYRVVFEVTGTDYTAEADLLNTENVSIYDETENKDLKQSSVFEGFVGKKIYYTTGKVRLFKSAGYISSDTGAVLTMTVYEDGKEVYKNSISVPDEANTTRYLQYYKNNMAE